MSAPAGPRRTPDLSLIMPCYNEEQVIGYTIPRLCRAFHAAGFRLELVACDNGSRDRTGEILRELQAQGLPVVAHRVEHNEGYGKGVLESLPHCSAPWIGIIPADGQVDAEDVVRVFESVARSDGRVLAKVYRRFRLDGATRALISFAYNLFMRLLWPKLALSDVNGSPKMMHASVIRAMKLGSKDWLLDPEMMIKAQIMGLKIIEMNVFARMREHGMSKVHPTTMFAFLRTLLRFRFGSEMAAWRREWDRRGADEVGAALSASPGIGSRRPA
jgi:glycosyltransferase involved in cell wall biosynthesis